jgi:hypothetical protein
LDSNGRVLLAHIVLFGYVYPDKRRLVPSHVIERLIADLRRDEDEPSASTAACRGTLLSREQYLFDIEQCGALDARIAPLGEMSPDDVALWTNAIPRARRVGLRRARSRRKAGTPRSLNRRDIRMTSKHLVRFAAVGDIHCTKDSAGRVPRSLRAGGRSIGCAVAVR